ncbi:MAG: hypothetical protein KME56_08415 [Candidatus Thiodiazotropha sp. (ex Ctena orbiculata)]|uniref:DUF2157 domain-containing protein n=1 Tax=Candidatus Thiodiazotropha taylori TaxID=2792791 RepID=A0A944QU68_9GAMM|nr:hypothetical protein [Candidatus Thiodiazotropha taylori]MBT2990738.1 hypothetical protein [Candidatus Thiodiazotropha taylori]MBT2996641.1 hypothetical protein [Candidatus Thiodiazotropha taylori]MBT3000681.1 hypothetical protein [Candidatus Thiodiazotropha taylori]MBT3027583.1 hypothetical protein [Candidatus Thiodiazotropha taylori]
MGGWQTAISRYLDVSTVLRLLGGGLTVIAIVLFLFQRWDDASDLLRYGMILGETLILTLLGFATSILLQEQKSARVFLGLSLVSTSAVFTILGAMIYSQVQWFPAVANLPDFAFWRVDSLNTVMLLLAGSFVILGGQSLLGFSVLVRPASRRLSLLLMLNVVLLLLPIRDMGITTLLVAPALLFSFHNLSRLRRTLPAMRTGEGFVAGILVLLPLIIMIGRGAYLYAMDAMAFGTIGLLIYLILRQLALSFTAMIRFRNALEIMSMLPALMTALYFTQVLDGIVPQMGHWLVVLFAVIVCGFLLDLAKRAVTGREYYFRAIFYLGLAVAIIEEGIWPGVTTALFATALSGAVLLYSYGADESSLLKLSLLTLIGSMVLLSSELLVTFDLGIWLSLAILGMLTIVLSATVERYGKQIISLVHRLKT